MKYDDDKCDFCEHDREKHTEKGCKCERLVGWFGKDNPRTADCDCEGFVEQPRCIDCGNSFSGKGRLCGRCFVMVKC